MMKVLLISENQNHTTLLVSAIDDCGLDCIHYRWFMKALDNVEEISPDLIVIDAMDFPRHWKVLAQYVTSSIFDEPVKVILYAPDDFSKEDIKKSKALKVFGMIQSKDKLEVKKNIEELSKKARNIDEKSLQVECKTTEKESKNPELSNVSSAGTEGLFSLSSVDNLFEDEVPTVSEILNESVPDEPELKETKENESPVSGNAELFTVDNLLENVQYQYKKKLFGSLLKRILEYYEKQQS
ncbi:MAG: hypothetical protein ACTTJG_02590 [Treponema sp.]